MGDILVFKKSKIILALPILALYSNVWSSEYADMYTKGKINPEKQKGMKFPDHKAVESCSKMPQGVVSDWGVDSIMYRANIKGQNGVLVADSFLSDSKVDELEKKYNKGCVFKTSVGGEDIFINVIGEGKERMVHWSGQRPAEICGNVTLTKPTEAQKQKSLADLRDDLRRSITDMIDKFQDESVERRDNLVNKSVASSKYEKYKEAWNGCLQAYKSMSDVKSDDLVGKISSAEAQYKFHNLSATFADTNVAIGGKLIGELNLSKPFGKELSACVDNLPRNKNINTVGDNIVFTGVEKGGEQKFYYKSSDGKTYSVSKTSLSGTGACQEVQGSGIKSCEYHNEVTLPSGERVGVDYLTSNVKQADGSYRQVEQVNFTNYLASNISYIKIPYEEADPKVAASAMVGSIQQALSNYPNDFTYHGANKISEETKDLFKQAFANCRDLLNEVAPSEKKWNEFAYQYSLGGKVLERGVASEDEGTSSNISK
jgi:hypothetical protein